MLFHYCYTNYEHGHFKRENVLLCECGWKGLYNNNDAHFKCPSCGASSYRDPRGISSVEFIDPNSDNSVTFQNIIAADLKSFDVEMHRLNVVFDKNSPDLIKLSQEVLHIYRIKVNLEPAFSIELSDNGMPMKPTISNIRKAMAFISFSGFPSNSIFPNLRRSADCSCADVIFFLKKYPVLEKVYLTDPSMESFKSYFDCLVDLDHYQVEPHRVFRLNKRLYKDYILLTSKIRFSLKRLYHIIGLFGEQKTIQYLEHGFQILIAQKVRSGSFLSMTIQKYFDIICRRDISIDPKALAEYLTDQIYTYQGIEHPSEGLTLLSDYYDMCFEMKVSPDKYPKSLKLAHDLASKNHKIFLDEEKKRRFRAIVEESDYKGLEYKDQDYCVLAPKSPEDLIHEGAELSHCVGSYVSKIINDGVKILFMRNTSNPDKSLLTLDVRNQELCFAAGFDNREPTDREKEFINKWVKIKKLFNKI